MSPRYRPGPAAAALTSKEGENWTFVLERNLRHPPEKVWDALTDPAHLGRWAPFDADGNLGVAGSTVTLTTVGTPTPHATETQVRHAEFPHLLEYSWGGNDIRWELEDFNGGTRLRLWAGIDRRYISMGAAGWHICLDVLDRDLEGDSPGRMAGPEVMKFEGWQRLNAEYARLFGDGDMRSP